MTKFAFLGHYIALEHFFRTAGFAAPIWRRLPTRALKSFIPLLPARNHLKIPITSPAGNKTMGYGIFCSLLPEHFVTLSPDQVRTRIIAAAQLGEALGAQIIGLGGFTSVVCNEGADIASSLNAAVTSGNTLTASLAIRE